jgi:hypothetical protein
VNFNEHSGLRGKHAFLSPSKYHWINYSNDKLDETFQNSQAAARGIELHAFAHHAIRLGIKLPRTEKTLNQYVNDAIGYRMTTEQILYFSDNCFGTSDTISFRNKLLRIHDLKTGVNAGSVHQLEVYAALFCLEYGFKPGAIDMELRIYQDDVVEICIPEVDTIAHVMSRIITFDRRIEILRAEG